VVQTHTSESIQMHTENMHRPKSMHIVHTHTHMQLMMTTTSTQNT